MNDKVLISLREMNRHLAERDEYTQRNASMLRCCTIALFLFAPLAAAGDKGSPTILRVATRELPSRFTPNGPLTDVDRQALDLLFEPLVAGGGTHYRPALAESLPFGQGAHLTFRMRPGATWSNGEAITADDVRHSIQKLRDDAGAEFAYAALLDEPQHGQSPREVAVSLRHGLINPLECFTFPIALQKDDDAALIGSGPFVLGGPLKDGVRFVKNAKHPAAGRIPFDEIHWFAAENAKDLESLNADVTLGFDAAGAVKTSPTRRVWYVAPNHRHPLLGQPELRTFLGLSLDRKKIVGDKLSVNGLTPRDSWAQAPTSQVRDDLRDAEIVDALAKKLAANKSINLSFKFPADQTVLMTKVVEQWHAAAKASGLNLKIEPVPLSATDLAQAISKRDFDLALVHEDHGDSLARLASLFDQRPVAAAPGGSNFMGVQDNELGAQLAKLPLTRQFPSLRNQMRNVHAHLVQLTMTVIPLWRHQAHHSLTYRVEAFDPLRPFADVSAWKK